MVLLFAQLGAVAHAYTHLRSGADGAAANHVRTLPCLECASCAPLLTLGGAAAALPVLEVADAILAGAPPAVARQQAAACRAYRSRAPPFQS
jgi:hypothetical protein